MGKKKSDIYSCFEILPLKNKANKSIFMCKFCDRQYLQNATKMESHIVTQCQKVPHNIRLAYAKVPGDYGGGGGAMAALGNRPSPSLSSDNSSTESRPETPVNLASSKANRPSPPSGGTSLVIKRAAGGTFVCQPDPKPAPKRPRVEAGNNGVITLSASQLRTIANNNNTNGLSNLNLTKYAQRQQNSQLYVQPKGSGGKGKGNGGGGIQINPKHMVPTSTIVAGAGGAGGSLIRPFPTQGSGMAVSPVGVDAFPKTFNHKELVEVWSLLARAVYATGCPLSLFENEHWKAAFKKIRPGLTLPTTDAVSNSLLKGEYGQVKKKMDQSIESVNFVTVHCCEERGDDEKKGPVYLSFYVHCPSVTSVYRVIKVNGEEEIDVGKFSSTLDAIGPPKVLAFVSGFSLENSDRTYKNWQSLKSLYPGLITFGCIYQGLNSLLDCILREDVIHQACLKGKKIVDGTKCNAELKKRFQELQRQLKLAPVPAFKFSSRSQWASLAKCVALLVSQKEAFQALIIESKTEFQAETKDLNYEDFLSDDYWTSLAAITNIIVPLSNWIKKVENGCSIGQVPFVFKELKEVFNQNVDNIMVLETTEKELIKKRLTILKRCCMNELHLAACLLTPKTRLEDESVLSADEEEEGAEFIHFFCETRGFQAEAALPQLSDYRNKTGEFVMDDPSESVWHSVASMEPLEWWSSLFFTTYPLAEVASHLIQISSCLCSLNVTEPLDCESLFSNSTTTLNDDAQEKLALIRHYNQKPPTVSFKNGSIVPNMKVQLKPMDVKVNGTVTKLQNGGVKQENDTEEEDGSPSKKEVTITVAGNGLPSSVDITPVPAPTNDTDAEADFRMEDHEPMDVTKFMQQNTGGFENEDDEEMDEADADLDEAATTLVEQNDKLRNLIKNGAITATLSVPGGEKQLRVDDKIIEDDPVPVIVSKAPTGNVIASGVAGAGINALVQISKPVEKPENDDDNDDSSSTTSSSSSSSSGSSSSSSSSSTSNNEGEQKV